MSLTLGGKHVPAAPAGAAERATRCAHQDVEDLIKRWTLADKIPESRLGEIVRRLRRLSR